MKLQRLALCLIFSFFLVAGASAQELRSFAPDNGPEGGGTAPGSLFSQNDACATGAPASQQFPDFGDAPLQSADDFTVPAGLEWTIDRVFGLGVFFTPNPNNGPIDNIVVQIWDDAGGLPGTMLCSEEGLNEGADPDYALTLTGACNMTLTEGTYWVSVMADMPFAPAGQWAWQVNSTASGTNEFAFQDPAGLLGAGPCNAWGAGITTCGIAATSPDLCFAFDGTEASAVNLIEVPTANTYGLGALAALLGLAAFFVMRRRS